MGLGRSLALAVLRTVSVRGSCRAVTFPCLIRVSCVAKVGLPIALLAVDKLFDSVSLWGITTCVLGLKFIDLLRNSELSCIFGTTCANLICV